MLEFLVIPGITIAGIGGFLCLAGGVFTAYYSHGAATGNIVLLSTIAALIVFTIIALKSKFMNKMILESDVKGAAVDIKHDETFKIGDRGKAITRLAPIGNVLINDKIVEAKSIDGFVDENTAVEIIKVQNTNVVVKPLK
ncbi:MAG: NfeD family protein [Bacteroidales bacterium]